MRNSHLTAKLSAYNDLLISTIDNAELNGITVTRAYLKDVFDQKFKNKAPEVQIEYFTDWVFDFCERATSLINPHTKRKHTHTKIKHYKKTANRLREFEGQRKLKWSDFTMDFYNKFVNFMEENRYARNTIGDLVKNIKVLLVFAENEGMPVIEDYKKFQVLREETDAIVFNEEEIDRIFEYDFSFNKRLENSRDLLIIGLWTGLRIGDILSLPKIKVDDKLIEVQPSKTKHSTGIKVVIPLHHHIKQIIKERGMPYMISDVKFNLYIKEVAEIIGFDEVVYGKLMNPLTKRKEAGYYPKYKLVTSHICRRSFATNMYKMNFPTLSIMKITGHKTETSFLKYIKVTPKEHAEKLLQHWEEYYKDKK